MTFDNSDNGQLTNKQTKITQMRKIVPDDVISIDKALTYDGKIYTETIEHQVSIKLNFYIVSSLLEYVDIYIHWGSYDELPEKWSTIKVSKDEIEEIGNNHYRINKKINAKRKGSYGVTAYAEFYGREQKHWQGRPNIDDGRFYVEHDSSTLLNRLETIRQDCSFFLKNTVNKYLTNSNNSIDTLMNELKHIPSENGLSKMVYDCTKDNENLCKKVSTIYSQAKKELRENDDPEKASKAAFIVNTLENLGLGEVVLVAPEGPHAIAGGLAHVMIGLLKTLSQQGVKVTLISPFYEYKHGNKHQSAEELLKNGFNVGDEHLNLKWIGEINIPFGPTYRSNSTQWKDNATVERSAVYSASSGNMRIILLRHSRYANVLYPARIGADEQLRRAIFLSRGALEVIKEPLFGVEPQNILSNDWQAALVPVFFKLDLRYSCVDKIKNAKTVHLIHNCGRDYHGRIPAQYNNSDLWPLLELAPEHFAGLADPQDNRFLNLTSGAILHLNGALLAVSKPYAKQLTTSEGGEGLDNIVKGKSGKIFGISNGIDQARLRTGIQKIGNKRLLGDYQTKEKVCEKFLGDADFLSILPKYKEAVKKHIQSSLGLEVNKDKMLLTFMGRIVEQKGLSLFNGFGNGDCISMLESLLLRYPSVQFIAAGPPVDGDVAANHFCSLVEYLSWKYPQRVRGCFDFVPHEYAIELLTATDLYLMPSRYEPGGITQLEALTCGAVVIARNVGGLSATLHGYGDFSDTSNSFLFDDYSSTSFRDVVFFALNELQDRNKLQHMMLQAASAKHDWGHRMPQYLALLQHLAGVLKDNTLYEYLDNRLPILKNMQV